NPKPHWNHKVASVLSVPKLARVRAATCCELRNRDTGRHARGPLMRIGRSGRPEVNETEARQGFLDRPVLVVLAVSLVLVIAAFRGVAEVGGPAAARVAATAVGRPAPLHEPAPF